MTTPPGPQSTSEPAPKRFYSAVTIAETEAGHTVTLDGRTARTPAKAPLAVPSRPLADALAEEWAAQRQRIEAETMPLTRLANTGIDGVRPRAAEVASGLARYGETDLVCYRAEQPRDLVARQAEVWQPLIDWICRHHGIRLVVTRGIVPIAQPSEALDRLAETLSGLDWPVLTALQSATAATGSIVIGLALIGGRVGAREAFDAAMIEELFQAERWGDDAEAAGRRSALLAEIEAAERFYRLAAC